MFCPLADTFLPPPSFRIHTHTERETVLPAAGNVREPACASLRHQALSREELSQGLRPAVFV